jgi:molybdopterin molybdotransferase/putative molybdopterin biosynthesis protein
MSIYLHDIPLGEAQARLRAALDRAGLRQILGKETIPLDEHALGRVLADPVWAKSSSPHYHAAAMDGFAVRADATAGAQPTSPISLPVQDGRGDGTTASAKYVDTGDPLPSWADAVIPIENVEALDEKDTPAANPRAPARIRLRAGLPPWTHVRPLGEDLVATQLVLPSGHELRPVDLGAVAAAGHSGVVVGRRPRVAIIPTGSELVPIGTPLKPGSILDYNSVVLAAQITSMGGEATRYPITVDDQDVIAEVVQDAAESHDLILLNAGSSAGREDFSARVIARLGEVLVHGVAVRPGHPVILGMIGSGAVNDAALPPVPRRPIIGVPGYPVSAALTLEIFVEPILSTWLGRPPRQVDVELAELTHKLTSPPGDEDYIRVSLARVEGRLLAAPLARGAGVITSLVQADGLVVVPTGTQGLEAGERVEVRLYRSRPEIERTIFCIGSHDMLLDLVAQHLAARGLRFISSNVGSQGGLIALRRGHGHLAGSHLLDTATGEYNVLFVRQYMPGIPVKLVALVGREQGLMVRAGNPMRILSLDDLRRPDLQFVNRQRGAGTRVLLDYHLAATGIRPSSIHGYGQEEYTHLGVAAAVASGRADCGLGIAAAARALELEFIPLFKERYDLVVPEGVDESGLLVPLWRLLGERGFREEVAALPGYDVSVMGQLILQD